MAKKMNLNEIHLGRITAVNNVEGQELTLKIEFEDGTEGIIPLAELRLAEENLDARKLARRYMGRYVKAKVISTNPLILSQVQAAAELSKQYTFEVGQTVTVVTTYVNKWRAELEYEYCVPMILPNTEYGWLSKVDLRQTLFPGSVLQVEIIDISDTGVITVSQKKFAPNPWPLLKKKYHPKSQYLGRVTDLLKSGVLVNLEPGVDVLCTPYPFFSVDVGDEVAVEIVDINPDAGRIKGYITAQAMQVMGR